MPIRDPSPSDAQSDWAKKIERRISDLETALRAGNTSIDRGSLRVIGDHGSIVEIGKQLDDYGGVPGVIISRPTGELAFSVLEYVPGEKAFVALWDASGNILASDDIVTGTGLARPWIPQLVHKARSGDYPTTTSGSFEDVWASFILQQYPYMQIEVACWASSGTTGEMQITVEDSVSPGVQTTVVGPVPIGSGQFISSDNVVKFPHFQLDTLITVHVQGRRTSGGGNVGIQPRILITQGSP